MEAKGKRTLKAKVEEAVESNAEHTEHKCIAAPGCGHVQKGAFNHGNFLRHLRTKHPDRLEYLEIPPATSNNKRLAAEMSMSPNPGPSKEPPINPSAGTPAKRGKKAKVSIELDRQQVLLGTLQLVTTNALPLQYPEWSGFQSLVQPTWSAFQLTMNRKNMADLVTQAAGIMRGLIKEQVSGKSVNLLIDSATRRNHHSLGISAQFFDEAQHKVVVRSLGKSPFLILQLGSPYHSTNPVVGHRLIDT